MNEPLCPFGDGSHKRRRWAGIAKHPGEFGDGRSRSGEVCVRCHKTWEWRGDQLLPTWSS